MISEQHIITRKMTEHLIKARSKHILNMDVYLTNYCNLNCHGCSRWCNIAKNKQIYDTDKLYKDVLTVTSRIKNVCSICLAGGEPLIHPDITQIVKFLDDVRKQHNISGIYIFTNGKKLLSLPDEFFKVMHETDTRIIYTYYNKSNINYDEIRRRLTDEKIKFRNVNAAWGLSENSPRDIFSITKFILPGKTRHSLYTFLHCGCNDSINLWQSKIYKCDKIGFIDTLNDNFGTDFKLIENDDYLLVDKCEEQTLFKWALDSSNFCNTYCRLAECYSEPWHVGKTLKDEIIEYKTI